MDLNLKSDMKIQDWQKYYMNLEAYKNLTNLQRTIFDYMFARLLSMPIFESDAQLAGTYGVAVSTFQHALREFEKNKLIIRNNKKEAYFDKIKNKLIYKVIERSIVLNSVIFPTQYVKGSYLKNESKATI